MARIVQKFGGTSVGSLERIAEVAKRAKAEHGQGNEVIVVVSAMSGETNRLIELCRGISPLHDLREYDTVVSAGEQVTSGLLAMALQEIGVPARSWQGWQIPIKTDDMHGKARITEIVPDLLLERLGRGEICVVPGFQGISDAGRVTTLGRGGSDTSAVALAAAVKADRCDIYTDVDGVFTCDPRVVGNAQMIEKITYEEMLEMASSGAKVLQTRSVEMAMNHGVRVRVRSSFNSGKGTLVTEEDEIVEQEQDVVTGIAYSRDEAKITLVNVPDQPGVAAGVFGPLAAENLNLDMIVQNVSENGKNTDITFTCGRGDLDRATLILQDLQPKLGYQQLVPDSNVAKISVIGVGMRSHAGVAKTMFETLAENAINIQVISTSEIKISVLVDDKYTELAVRALHTAYGLDAA